MTIDGNETSIEQGEPKDQQDIDKLLHQVRQKCASAKGWVATYTKSANGGATLAVVFPSHPVPAFPVKP